MTDQAKLTSIDAYLLSVTPEARAILASIRELIQHNVPDALETINRWYDQGHIICFFTTRTENLKQITIDWLDKHGFKYHSVLCGKPRGGNYHWIDNHLVKATRYKGKFTDMVERQVTIEVFKD